MVVLLMQALRNGRMNMSGGGGGGGKLTGGDRHGSIPIKTAGGGTRAKNIGTGAPATATATESDEYSGGVVGVVGALAVASDGRNSSVGSSSGVGSVGSTVVTLDGFISMQEQAAESVSLWLQEQNVIIEAAVDLLVKTGEYEYECQTHTP